MESPLEPWLSGAAKALLCHSPEAFPAFEILAGDTIRDAGRAPREAKSGYRENTISGVSARNNHYL
jgi:hypothetical protein